MRKIETLEMALERIKELEAENQKLNEELEYYRNRKVSGRQKHNDKWQSIYNDFVVLYESGMSIAEIAKEKLIAAAHGDRSENAEYKAACEEYRENDNRIQHLLTLITTATVIEDESIDKSILGINTKAKIEFIDDGFEDIITLVTTLDAKPEEMLISIESELGKALAGKKVGDIVEVDAPGENYSVKILEIL